MRHLENQTLHILFVSPEKLCSVHFLSLMKRLDVHVPFVAVDEIHCMSQWSHNFRYDFDFAVVFKFMNVFSVALPHLTNCR